MAISLLHVDDSLLFLDRLKESLQVEGEERIDVTSTTTAEEFQKALVRKPFDIAVIDIMLDQEPSNEQGLELIQKALRLRPGLLVLMCSSDADPRRVRASLAAGAYDFITKTVDPKELRLRLFETYRHFVRERGFNSRYDLGYVIGASMRQIGARIPRLIQSSVSSIHVCGPSGTGKEAVADLFARHLPPETPFVRVHCGALTATLIESELFGHAKGAFTGALSAKIGLIEVAHGGFIFLDEVATLSDAAQVALLRVLENKTVRRVGEVSDRKVDVRIISATNEVLPELVKQGRFRRDLWQRLCEVEIELKPLAQRPDEIPELIDYFLGTLESGPFRLEPAARKILESYTWPDGNVRELRNCLRAMTAMSLGTELTALSIPGRILAGKGNDSVADKNNALTLSWAGEEIPSHAELCDLLLIEHIRLYHRLYGPSSLRNFAKSSGISRSTLSSRLQVLSQEGKFPREEIQKLLNKSAGIAS